MTSLGLLILSGAVLGLELVLVRALSISNWHHFSHLVISTALLGFGVGGTFVTLFSKRILKSPHRSAWLSSLLFAVTLPVMFLLTQRVGLDELQLIWDKRQLIYLLAYYFFLFVPFFFAACTIAVVFASFGFKAHRLYFCNMTGSGLGSAAIVALMYIPPVNSPTALLLVISAAGFLAAFLFAFNFSRRISAATIIFAAVWLFLFSAAGPCPLSLKISENKALVYYRNLPGAQTLATRYSPLGRIDFIDAPAVRIFPGLSISYTGRLPEQGVLLTDADSASAVNRFDDVNELNCFRHTTSALAYHLLNKPRVCIIGSGGGSDVAQALAFEANDITAVEMNSKVTELLSDELSEKASGIYERKDVNVVVAEGRNFVETTKQRFDLINISLLDSYSATAAGLFTLRESHLYTIEAIDGCLDRLDKQGMLSITRFIKIPPRDSLKMLATLTEALLNRGIRYPAEHIIIIRGYQSATLLVGKQKFSAEQIEAAKTFARANSFDLVHIPGITPDMANRFDILETPYYYNAAQAILSEKREQFYDDYGYYIKPATDDRPYFFDFFKLSAVPRLIEKLGRRWLVFTEWGYILLVVNLIQAAVISTVLILLPVFIRKGLKSVGRAGGAGPVLLYFLLLGFAYMFLEMAFIQKMTLVIGRPVFGVAVTLVGFLFFSGCGSLAAQRVRRETALIRTAVAAIAVAVPANILLFRLLFDSIIALSTPLRLVASLTVIASAAFFMGMPFPTGLRAVYRKSATLTAWGWAVNGFASVVGAVAGTLLAVSLGFTSVAIIAVVFYVIAAIVAASVVD